MSRWELWWELHPPRAEKPSGAGRIRTDDIRLAKPEVRRIPRWNKRQSAAESADWRPFPGNGGSCGGRSA